MPADPAIPAKGVPAAAHFTRPFEQDKKILQREAVGGSPALQLGAYIALGVIGLIWVGAVAFGLRRLDRVERRPTDRFTRGLLGTTPERSQGKQAEAGVPFRPDLSGFRQPTVGGVRRGHGEVAAPCGL